MMKQGANKDDAAPNEEYGESMEGMVEATVTIDSAEKTTVYMIDFTPTTGGEEVKNHKVNL